jgi:LCP family protein required for cell wall assembly
MARTPVVGRRADEEARRPTAGTLRKLPALTGAQRVRRAVTLLLMSVIAPGTAQLAAGNRRVGRIVLRIWLGTLVLMALGGLLALVQRQVLLRLATSPTVLVVVALLLFAAAAGWPVVLLDAWRLGRPYLLPRRSRVGVSILALGLVLVTAVPLVGAGRRVWAGADFINGVFSSGSAAGASHGRFNVLLMGGDAGPDRVGTRPDSMTLVSVDATTGRTVLFSLPRNLEDVPFAPGSTADRAMPQGWSCGDDCLLNGLYTWGQEHKALFPGVRDPGAAAMKQAVAGVTGLEVPYYVLVDLRGFSELVQALGGIDVTVSQKVPIGGGTSRVSGYIEPGHQHLDGYHALWYARSRHGANDYERMARQRCVMDAMLHQLDPATVLLKFEAIAAAGKNVVTTDIPAAQLDTFIDLAGRARSQKISNVQFVPPLVNPARPDYSVIRSKVSAAITASVQSTDVTASGVTNATTGGAVDGVTEGPVDREAGPRAPLPGVSSSPSGSPVPEASDITAVCSPG